MKILFVIGSLIIGGKERQCIELIKGLSEKGFECELIVLKNSILYPEIYSVKCKLHVLDSDLTKFRLWLSIFQIVRNAKPDIVQSWDTQSAMYLSPIVFILNIPFVNYCIRYAKKIKKNSKYGIISRTTFLFSDFVVANSIAGLGAHGLNFSAKNRYVYNGYDLNRAVLNQSVRSMKDKLNLDDQYVIGMVGNFLDAKDHKTIVDAAQTIMSRRKDITVVFIGNGPKLPEIKKLILVENLNRFVFLEKITKVEEYINMFDIHCLICNTNGHAEGLSNAIMEGMAMGKPIIATNSGGNKEIVSDGVTGYIIEPFDVNALIEKLEFLLNNSEVRKRFGNTGRERIEKEFSLESLSNNFIKLYREVLDVSNSNTKNETNNCTN